MGRFNYNSVGQGDKPKLGAKSFTEGLARPGGSSGGHTIGQAKTSMDIPKVARPGSRQGTKGVAKADVPKAARPGSRNPNSAR